MKNLISYKKRIEKELEIYFENKKKKGKEVDTISEEIINSLQEYTLRGGKRIRSALVYFTYKGFSNNNEKEIIKASMALELIQSFLLIHDDIIDQDDLRRGKPSLHKKIGKIIKEKYKTPKHEHIGISLALLAGDICFALANEIIIDSKFNNKVKINAIKYLNQIVRKVGYGEALDVLSIIKPRLNNQEIKKISHLKTASYTFSGPMVIGAILAGVNKTTIKKIEKATIPLGEAFQIQDDILGLSGDEKKLGKPIGSDLEEGKKTLILIETIKRINKKESDFIKKCLGKKIDEKKLNRIRNLVKESGALNHCNEYCESLIESSKEKIKKLKLKPNSERFILELCDYMKKRDY